jgi:predicted CXXCH cytochrome family protein
MRLLLLVFSVLFFALLPNNDGFAASSKKDPLLKECLTCHTAAFEKELLKKYIHQPFADRKCLECHVNAKDSLSPADQPSPDQQARAKIRWLCMSPSASEKHTFLLPAQSAPGKIFIDAKALGKSRFCQSLPIPAASTMEKTGNDKIPPRIAGIRTEVRQGILINSVITWQTDEKTNATVHYGIEDMGQTVEEKYCFVTDHKMTLPGLKNGSAYQVAITCRDIFGNSTTSPIFSFSTADISPSPAPASEHQSSNSEKIAIKNNLFTTDNKNIMLELTANQPVSIALGTSDDEPAARPALPEKSVQSDDTAEEHVPLASKKYSSMTICSTCHQGFNLQKSHPVDILPRGKTKIPPEYPTLPDGRISCMTCHVNHAANIEYRLIKSSRKELCLGCHPDKF